MPDEICLTRLTGVVRRGWAAVLGASLVALVIAVVVPRYQPVGDTDEAILSDADGVLDATHVPKECVAVPPAAERLLELATAWVASCDVAHDRVPRPALLSRAAAPRAPPHLLA